MSYKIGQVVIDNTQNEFGSYTRNSSNEYFFGDSRTEIISHSIRAPFGISALSKFGIQSRPGAVFAIGDEIIVIGRSGTYELANDLIKIDKLYVLSPDIFIIDFRE